MEVFEVKDWFGIMLLFSYLYLYLRNFIFKSKGYVLKVNVNLRI